MPTPGSPIRQGLFLLLRERIWITLLISSSLPITGSILPCFASSVKSLPNSSRVGVFVLPFLAPFVPCFASLSPLLSDSIRFSRSWLTSTPSSLMNLTAYESLSLTSDINRCSVPTNECIIPLAIWNESSMILFDLGVKSSGESLVGFPTPISSLISLSTSSSVIPFSLSVAAPKPVPSLSRPTKICSLPT